MTDSLKRASDLATELRTLAKELEMEIQTSGEAMAVDSLRAAAVALEALEKRCERYRELLEEHGIAPKD